MYPVVCPDLHGRSDLLAALTLACPERQFVFLGDLGDRGPDTAGVLRQIRQLVADGRASVLMGNHDAMWIDSALSGEPTDHWLNNGGQSTIDSYPDWETLVQDARWMQAHLFEWMVEGPFLFSHGMRPGPGGVDVHRWGRPVATRETPATPVHPLPGGVRRSLHGHTVFDQAPLLVRMEDGSDLLFLDAGAYETGRLTCYDCETQEVLVIGVPLEGEPDAVPVLTRGHLTEARLSV